MNPMAVLASALAVAAGAPAPGDYAAAAAPASTVAVAAPALAAQPLAYAAQPVAYAAQPVAYAAPAAPAPVVPAPYTTEHIQGADVVTHSQAAPLISKSLEYGSQDFVSGYQAQVYKPAIPDFKIAVPTALKSTVTQNAPIVKVAKETHVVNEPYPVVKEVQVPYDVPVYKEQIVEVPTPVQKIKPVAVKVPYAVPGKQIVQVRQTAPIVQHTQSVGYAQPLAAAPVAVAGHAVAAPHTAYQW